MMWYNLHHENMHKMQREKTRNGFLSTQRKEGMQTMQKQAHGQNEPTISSGIERDRLAALLAETDMPMSEMSLPKTRHRLSFARSHQRQRRAWARSSAEIVSVDKKRGVSIRIPSALFQLQPRQVWKRSVSALYGWRNAALKNTGNAIVSQVAIQILQAIKLCPSQSNLLYDEPWIVLIGHT